MSDSIKTKNAIAQGFKELMEKKAFAKITVSDITSKCGLNRQTFYYHFQDKYELLNWIFYNEAIEPFVEGLSLFWGLNCRLRGDITPLSVPKPSESMNIG